MSECGASSAEDIKQQNWEPSSIRFRRCYATDHSSQPPSNIVTSVINGCRCLTYLVVKCSLLYAVDAKLAQCCKYTSVADIWPFVACRMQISKMVLVVLI